MAVNNQGPGGMAGAAAALKQALNETVGPMAVLGAGAIAFTKYMAGAAANAEKMAAALRASADAKRLEGQFKVILGSAEQARKKVAELAKEAARSPFAFAALGKAALNLQVLSRGAFASVAALRQVQDIAAATGNPVDTVAAAMGDLVGALKRGGAGAGAAAAQLAAMGAISQSAAEKIQNLAERGSSMGQAMRVIQGETIKAKGAAAALADTIDGLQQQMANLQEASDAKIGKMFEDGEKAGLRAAIGFQKFNNAVQEAASGPYAQLSGAINTVKESFANFLASLAESGKLSGIISALTALSQAVLGVLAVSLAKGAYQIGQWALKAIAASRAAQGLAGATGLWGSLMTKGGLATLGAATALLSFAQNAYDAVTALQQLNEELQKQDAASREVAGKFAKQGASVGTVEEKQAFLNDIDAEIAAADEDVRRKQAAAIAAREKSDAINATTVGNTLNSLNPFGNFAGIQGQKAFGEAQAAETSLTIAQTNAAQLRAERSRVANIATARLGMDSEQDQRARDRMQLEKDIRREAFDRVQEGSSPRAALRSARLDEARKTTARERAEQSSKVTFEERQALLDAESKIRLDETDPEKITEGIEGLRRARATTKTSQLSRDIAVRETLVAQNAQLEQESRRNLTVPERQDLERRQQAVRAQIEAIGGAGEVSGARIQDLQRQRDFAAKQEDPNAARAAEAEAQARAQSLAEAVAAEEALQKAKQRTLALENALAGVASDGASAQAAVVAESENRTAALQKALAAAQALEAAQSNFDRAVGTSGEDAARQSVNQARIAAEVAGTGGRGVSEIQSALQIEQQILQANLNQARITQAAAQARLEAAQRQLNTEKMIAQMNLKSAEANVNNTNPQQDQTRAQIESDAADRAIAAEERALAAAKAKDAAEKAVVANPNEANKRALDAANQAAAAAGVGGRTPEEVQADLASKRVAKANQEAERIDAAQTEAERVKLASLRAQEQYGPNKEQARKEANALEDSMAVEARTKELGATIKDPAIAAGLASAEVEMARAMSNIEQRGQPAMGEMASVGGSAGFGGLVNNDTKDLKAIKEAADKIRGLMNDLKTQQKEAFDLTRRALAQAEAEMGQ